MLAALLNAPRTPDGWNRWGFHHRDSHTKIRVAIQKKFGVNLIDYQLDPITEADFQSWLQRNSQMHGDFSAVLGITNYDLLDVNTKDQKQLEAWNYLHYFSHWTAENSLGI